MENFKNFCKAYQGLASAKANLLAVSRDMINVYRETEWYSRRNSVIEGINTAMEELRKSFRMNFPKTSVDAFLIDDFTVSEFLDFLKKNPELAKENRENFEKFLNELKTCDLKALQLEHVPDIKEFIK